MGMSVNFYDVEAKLPLGNAKSCASLAQLLASSDVVTLHVPGGAETENLINAQTLAQMKEGAIVINASRGTVVDINALIPPLRAVICPGRPLMCSLLSQRAWTSRSIARSRGITMSF